MRDRHDEEERRKTEVRTSLNKIPSIIIKIKFCLNNDPVIRDLSKHPFFIDTNTRSQRNHVS